MQTDTSPREMFLGVLILLDDEQATEHKPPERCNEIREDPEKITSTIKEKGMGLKQEETKKLACFILERCLLSGVGILGLHRLLET